METTEAKEWLWGRKVHNYVSCLNEDALRSALSQILMYPESTTFLKGCIEEYYDMYTLPKPKTETINGVRTK